MQPQAADKPHPPMPKISVIIPAYNGKRYLAQAIESVLAQTMVDWELVLVDDGSKDGTASLATGFTDRDARIRLVRQDNSGVAAARNRGFTEADPAAEYVIFLDQDDVWEPDALETLHSALESDRRAIAAHGLLRFTDEQGRPFDDFSRKFVYRRPAIEGERLVLAQPAHTPTTFATLVFDNVIFTPGVVLIRRHALEAVGPFDATMVPSDDWDMWLRLSLIGYLAFVDRLVLSWRRHADVGSRDITVMQRARRRVCQKLMFSQDLTREQNRLVHIGCRYYERLNRRDASKAYWGWFKEEFVRREWYVGAKHLRHAIIEFNLSIKG